LRLQLEDFVDSLVVKVATQADVYDAIVEEIGDLKTAYDRDPDPGSPRRRGRRTVERVAGGVAVTASQ
jgi:hypothetical protein